MKVFLLGLSLCLALLVGAALWLSYGDCTALPQRLYLKIVLREQDSIGHDVRFKVRMMGSGRTPDGHSTDFTDVRASDCVEVTSESVRVDSPMQAESEMEEEIRRASRVVEQGLKVDLPMHPTGQRVVLLFEKEGRAEVLLRFKDDSKLHRIESASLAHALAYEKLIQRGYRFDPHGYVIAMGQ
jgi:hypothetical protein